MTRKSKQPPIPMDVEIERDGKTYRGTYTVQSKMISVTYNLMTNSTQLGGSPAESLARIMLGEFVDAERKRSGER